jgi:hypothetical protein
MMNWKGGRGLIKLLYRHLAGGTEEKYEYLQSGVDKTKNNSGASIFFFLHIRAKKTINQTKIKLYIFKCDLKTSNLLINTRLD